MYAAAPSRTVMPAARDGLTECNACTDGANGFPSWGIPPGGTLNFEIELLKVTPDLKIPQKKTEL